MFRRVLFVASMLVMLWAGPASAEHTYGHVLDTGQNRGGAQPVVTNRPRGDNLARTGSNNVTPLLQAAVVLIGGGTMLVFVARRRQVARRATA